jgi:uncharacterized protein with PIN domain
MNQASFRFYAELNDFLPEALRHKRFQHRFRGQPGIKDVIEALGVPHTEVELILVNGQSVEFDYGLKRVDSVSVYPRFHTLDLSGIPNVSPPALDSHRFVLDTHLGRLAAYLRMLGFDSLYWNDTKDERLAEITRDQQRVLLTRDRGLLKRNSVTYGYCVRETNPRAQLVEVVRHFHTVESIEPFKHCMRCNGVLQDVEKDEVLLRLPKGVRENCERFRICPDCGRIYWSGSHTDRMQQLIASVIDKASDRKSSMLKDEDHNFSA